MQYEDGDKEEFLPSELKRKLQPVGEGDRTDFEALDRLYAEVKAEWAAGTASVVSMYQISVQSSGQSVH